MSRRILFGLVAISVWGIHDGAQAVTVPGDFPTIQGAIDAVLGGPLPNGTVIEVGPGTHSAPLRIIDSARSLTLRATAGPASTVIDADGTGRSALYIMRAPGGIRIEGFTFRGGTGGPGSDTGGGFTVQDSHPTLVNCVFEGNRSQVHGGGGSLVRSSALFQSVTFRNNTAANFGGGVFVGLGSNPTFVGVTIANNRSGTSAENGAGGGIMVADASATIRRSTITGNQSKFAAGGILALTHFTMPKPSTVLIEDSVVTNNVTVRATPSSLPSIGGGIHAEDNLVMRVVRTRVASNRADAGGGFGLFRGRLEVISSFVESNTALDPTANGRGGGILATSSGRGPTLVVTDSVIRDNRATGGGGIYIVGDANSAAKATLLVSRSLIDQNVATAMHGGGILAYKTTASVTGTQILRNAAPRGGGLALLSSNSTIADTTVAENGAGAYGGGFYVDNGGAIQVSQSRIYANSAGSLGGGLYVGPGQPPLTGSIEGSIIADNSNFQIHEHACPPGTTAPVLSYADNTITPAAGTQVYRSPCNPPGTLTVSQLNGLPGGRAHGNLGASPVFASFTATPDRGPSVLAWSVGRAGAIDIIGPGAGPVGPSEIPTGTLDVAPTCTSPYELDADSFPDSPAVVVARPRRLVALGSGFLAYGAGFSGGIFVAVGDVDGDGRAEIITVPGAGGVPFVRVLKVNSAGGVTPFAQFYAYGSEFRGGVYVAAGDVDGDGRAEIITAPGAGGVPFVRVLKVNSAGGVTPFAQFYAYGSEFRGGVYVAAGDVDGDGRADVVTGPGPGSAPTVRVFRVSPAGGVTTFAEFLSHASTYTGGVPVAAGDVDRDGFAEVIAGIGAGTASAIRVFNVGPAGASLLRQVTAYDPTFRGGILVAAADIDPAAGVEILSGPGLGGGGDVHVYGGAGQLLAQRAIMKAEFAMGVRVAAGNVDGAATAEIVAGAGPGGEPRVWIYRLAPCS